MGCVADDGHRGKSRSNMGSESGIARRFENVSHGSIERVRGCDLIGCGKTVVGINHRAHCRDLFVGSFGW